MRNRKIKCTDELHILTNAYFNYLYANDVNVDPTFILSLVQPKVNFEMNEKVQPFNDEEIRDGLFQIRPLKASGSDGFLARFFQ